MVQNVQLQFVYTTSSKFMASTVASTAEGSSLNLELQTGSNALLKNCLFGKETNYPQSSQISHRLGEIHSTHQETPR